MSIKHRFLILFFNINGVVFVVYAGLLKTYIWFAIDIHRDLICVFFVNIMSINIVFHFFFNFNFNFNFFFLLLLLYMHDC
jgi:hypothetical protein